MKTGIQRILIRQKGWMCSLASFTPPPFGRPAGVYPDENRGRNDDIVLFRNSQSLPARSRFGEGRRIPHLDHMCFMTMLEMILAASSPRSAALLRWRYISRIFNM